MSRFPSANHLASWAGVCRGNKQSAGKRLGGKTTHGDTWLRALLGEGTWSLAPPSMRLPRCASLDAPPSMRLPRCASLDAPPASSSLAAPDHRFARRIGKRQAVVAVSHALLVRISHLLATHSADNDLGPGSFDSLEHERLQRHSVRRLEQLGFAVTLTSPQTT